MSGIAVTACERCGSNEVGPDGVCRGCGARAGEHSTLHGLAVCSRCGYRGQGITYFSRTTHAALLTAAALLTYGLGGLLYWGIKRGARVCPGCGASWSESRLLSLPPGSEASTSIDGPTRSEPGRGVVGKPPAGSSKGTEASPGLDASKGKVSLDAADAADAPDGRLPRSGLVRRVTGVMIGLVAVLLLSLGLVFGDPVALAISFVAGLTGALGVGWGLQARRARREAVLRRMQRRVLELADARGGRLTATEVAMVLDLSLAGAERVLFSLEDGFRVRSDVTSEGILVFEFRESGIPGGNAGTGILRDGRADD